MIVGILLAAGSSTRFGAPKLLHPLPDGRPIALAALQNLAPAVDEVIAVVRPDDQALIELLTQPGVHIVPNYFPQQGMSSSLATGVRARPDAAGWLIALADMPEIPTAVAHTIAAQLRDGTILAAPSYQGQRGHPVGFARELFAELIQLEGDSGARGLLAQHATQLRLLEVEAPGILRDIDTPTDLSGT